MTTGVTVSGEGTGGTVSCAVRLDIEIKRTIEAKMPDLAVGFNLFSPGTITAELRIS